MPKPVKLVVAVVVVLGTVLAAAYWGLDRYARGQFTAEVVRIAATGAPVRPADFDFAAVSDEENAAVGVQSAMAWLASGNYPEDVPGMPPGMARSQVIFPAFAGSEPEVALAVLERIEPCVLELTEAVRRSRANWSIGWDDPDGEWKSPDFLELRNAANILVVRAVVAAQAEDGKADTARHLQDALRLHGHQDTSAWGGYFSAMATLAVTLEGMREVLDAPGCDARQVRQAIDEPLARAISLERLRRSYEGERALSVSAWEAVAGGPGYWLDGVATLRVLDGLIKTADAPFHQVESRVATLMEELVLLPWYCEFSKGGLPGLLRTRRPVAELRSRVQLGRVALAALAFEEEHHHWPRDTAELGVLFPDGVPTDPLTGEAFSLTQEDGALHVEGALESKGWILPARDR